MELMEKQIGLKDTFNPFLKVLHPETPGTKPSITQRIVRFQFKYALKEHRRIEEERQSQGLEAKPMSCMIAANIHALKVAKKHGLFKLASKLYKLFLTCRCEK